jgi:PAS domain S-box-containing protein
MTPSKASEAALSKPSKELDKQFRDVMDAAPVMIWVTGSNKLCIWCNKSWLAFTGRSLGQEIGNGWAEGVHPDDRERCLASYGASFEARSPFRMQYRLRRHDGEFRWIDVTGIPRYDEDGTFLGYIGSCTDVQETHAAADELNIRHNQLQRRVAAQTVELQQEKILREEAQARASVDSESRKDTLGALEQSEQRFRLLVQSVVDYAIFMLDAEGFITNWNPGAERIKGYKASEIIGQHFSRFYTEEDRAAGVPARALATAAKEGKFEAEGWRVRKDGSRFWASVVIDPIRSESGEIIGFAKVTRDMTEARNTQEELRRAREQLFQMQKLEAVGQLTGGVAHDFNNLLTIIIGSLEIAQRNVEKGQIVPAQQMRLLGNALTGAKRAATLTQRLLAFARRQPLDPKPLNVNKFISGIGEFLQRILGESIHVEAVGSGGLWPVEVDPVQLESAILNLALNARDAMPDGGKLTVEASNIYLDQEYGRTNPEISPGQYVVIAVSDTGIGMAPETVARAFEPFFTTKAVGQGTGLGLSQVYGFVKQSGGNVKVYSEVGEGTTIRIYLPRMTHETASTESDAQLLAASSGGETILVVEDDPAVLEYIVEVLTGLNYAVLYAENGRVALEYIHNPSIHLDLLLTDVVMPGMNGRELADQARQKRPQMKVLFMTGYSQNAVVHHGRLDPGVNLIQKPLSESQLANRIRDVLETPLG